VPTNNVAVAVDTDHNIVAPCINKLPVTDKSPYIVDELALDGEPILIKVFEPVDPFVPILTVFTFPDVVAP
jgi:hypothetical protein